MKKSCKIILRNCKDYNLNKIYSILGAACEELALKPRGSIFIKPNAVFSAGYNPHAYTHPTVLQALIRFLKKFNPRKIILGEDCGLMVPTRYAFERAGYFKLIKEEKIGYALLDEDKKKVRVPTTGTVHTSLLLPREWIDADFKIFLPKLKGHSQTTITNALKLAIGLVDRSERLVGHDYRLDEKIGDLAVACPPDLVITDAIVAGQLGAGLPKPYPLGLLIIGENPLAVDSVAAFVLGHDPQTIGHLRAVYERRVGPIDLSQITITGDVSVAEAQARAQNFEREPDDANYLNPRIRFFVGSIPKTTDNCIGGCLGFAREALLFINAYKNDSRLSKIVQRLVNRRSSKPRTIALVVGDYRNPIPDDAGPILLLGDCAQVDGRYRRRIIKRIKGCPVFMGRSVYHVAQTTGITNPYLDVKEGYPFLKNLLVRKLKTLRR